MKHQSYDEFKDDLKKLAGGEIKSPIRQGEEPEFTIEEYFDGKYRDKFEGETEDYVQEEWTPETYDGHLKYVNCGVQKIRKMLETETDKEEIRLLNIAMEFCRKMQPGIQAEAGEPYRGEKKSVKRVNNLRELL